MAAATSAIVAVAGLGLTAYQMYDANEKGKDAKEAADRAKKDLLSVKEQNQFADLQVADLQRLQREQDARTTQAAITGLREAGAEAVLGGVPKVAEQARESELQTSLEQARRIEERDRLVAAEDARIESGRAGTERAIYGAELTGAQTAAAEADIAKAQATADLITGAGNVALGAGEATSLESKAQRKAKRDSKSADPSLYSTGSVNEDTYGFGPDQELYDAGLGGWG